MKKAVSLLSALILGAVASSASAQGPHRKAGAPLVVGAVSHLLLPSSAYANGQFGAVFKTRIVIHNVTGYQYDIRAGFSTQDGEVAHSSFTIRPYETLTFDNFINDVLHAYGGGAIDLDSGNDAYRFITTDQVYVDTSSGRYSTAVQPADDAGTIIAGRPGYVAGVSVDSFERTNFGCASDSSLTQTITAEVMDPSTGATISTISFTLAPFGWNQVSVTTPITNGTLLVNAGQRAVCYGVTVDNRSNDGTFILAVPN
jgi:hypothetical protein